LVIYRA